MNTDKYLDIPFIEGGRSYSGCDCAGLVLLALKEEKGVVAGDFSMVEKVNFGSREGKLAIEQIINDLMDEWVVVQHPAPFDLVRMQIGGVACHVGLYLGEGEFLHIDSSMHTPDISRTTSLRWHKRIIEYRRHRDLL